MVAIEVEPGSPSERAGLRPSTVIIEVDGQAVPTPAAFAKAVAQAQGRDVTLTVQTGAVGKREVVVSQ